MKRLTEKAESLWGRLSEDVPQPTRLFDSPPSAAAVGGPAIPLRATVHDGNQLLSLLHVLTVFKLQQVLVISLLRTEVGLIRVFLMLFALLCSSFVSFFVPHRNEIQQQSNEQTHVIRLAQIDSDRQRSVRGRVSQLNVSAKVSESFCFLSPDWFTADRSQQVRMPKCPGRHGNHRLFNVMWRQREDLVRARVCVCLLSPSSYLWHTLCW